MEISESEVLSLAMVVIRQGHLLLKLGLIVLSLVCYAVLLLHPFVAHAFEDEGVGQVINSTISTIIEQSEIVAKLVIDPLTSQADCPVCRQITENPVALFWIPPLWISLLLISKQNLDSVQQFSSKVFIHWLSRAPPSRLESINQ